MGWWTSSGAAGRKALAGILRHPELELVGVHAHAASKIGRDAAEQIARYLGVSRAALGGLPTKDRLVLERFFDDAGGVQLVIHTPRGGRLNRGLCLALRTKFCKSFNFELQAAANDDATLDEAEKKLSALQNDAEALRGQKDKGEQEVLRRQALVDEKTKALSEMESTLMKKL